MPKFIAVQCFQCEQYQVSQKRKDSKFNCKICGSKQSVRKIAARSNKAADVRKFVQKLNLTRGQAAEQYADQKVANASYEPVQSELDTFEIKSADPEQPPLPSKWEPYASAVRAKFKDALDVTKVERNEGNVEDEGEDDIVTALPDVAARGRQKRRRATDGSARDGMLGKRERRNTRHDRNEGHGFAAAHSRPDRNLEVKHTAKPSGGMANVSRWASASRAANECHKATELDGVARPRMGTGSIASKGAKRWNEVVRAQQRPRHQDTDERASGEDFTFTSLGDEVVVEEQEVLF